MKKNKKQHALIYISIIAVFSIFAIAFFSYTQSNKYATGFAIKDTQKPAIIATNIYTNNDDKYELSLTLFDNNGINKVIIIYSIADENGKEKLTSTTATRANKALQFEKTDAKGSYYTAKIQLTNAKQGSRLFVVVSDFDNNKENKIVVVE